MPLWTVAKGLRAIVRTRRRARGPLRPSWDDTYETLARVLHEYSKRAHVELDVWDDMIHAWHIFAPIIDEGRRAITRIGEFMKQTVESQPLPNDRVG
jgi:uncharacterized protein YktB (UPF0637 family)